MDTILVVDDEPANISVIVENFRETHRVLAATSGQKALEIVASAKPDLVLLDVQMPGMDGYEVCRKIKADPVSEPIPVLFVSAHAQVDDKTQGFEAGGVDYIAKPFEPAELHARVAAHLELKKAAEFREEVERITRHDLKSPLQALIAIPDIMLYDGNLTEDQKENLELIQDSARKMLRMINVGLDLFKMERGMYVLDPAPVDLGELLRGIVRARERQFGGATPIDLTVSEETIVAGEELLLYSLFHNLIQNAYEATEPGVPIVIRVGSEGNHARVAIQNSGEVPVSIRQTFFDKFVTAGKDGGTGLGTYSAYLIARTLGGAIELDAGTPGQTTVQVTLVKGGA